jgi:hypothetical protein
MDTPAQAPADKEDAMIWRLINEPFEDASELSTNLQVFGVMPTVLALCLATLAFIYGVPGEMGASEAFWKVGLIGLVFSALVGFIYGRETYKHNTFRTKRWVYVGCLVVWAITATIGLGMTGVWVVYDFAGVPWGTVIALGMSYAVMRGLLAWEMRLRARQLGTTTTC